MTCKIRPHHGMCFAFFRGAGYNDAFAKNMQKIKEILDENPEVILLCGADDVCCHCPNNLAGTCTDPATGQSLGKAEGYDLQVLAHCGLKEGCKIRWKDFAAAVQTHILDIGKREIICGDCEWSSLCH